MSDSTNVAAGPTVHELKQLQCELYRLCNERESALVLSAGAHALAYLTAPSDVQAQRAALSDKHLMEGLLMAKDRYSGEVRYFDGDGKALLARCLAMFTSLAAYEHQEAERIALSAVHLEPCDAEYRKTSLEAFRHLQREAGVRKYSTMFQRAFASFLGQLEPAVVAAAA